MATARWPQCCRSSLQGRLKEAARWPAHARSRCAAATPGREAPCRMHRHWLQLVPCCWRATAARTPCLSRRSPGWRAAAARGRRRAWSGSQPLTEACARAPSPSAPSAQRQEPQPQRAQLACAGRGRTAEDLWCWHSPSAQASAPKMQKQQQQRRQQQARCPPWHVRLTQQPPQKHRVLGLQCGWSAMWCVLGAGVETEQHQEEKQQQRLVQRLARHLPWQLGTLIASSELRLPRESDASLCWMLLPRNSSPHAFPRRRWSPPSRAPVIWGTLR